MNKDWQKKTQKRGGKILSLLLAGVLACSIFSTQVLAMDPGELENPIQDPGTSTSEPAPSSSEPTPSSSEPAPPPSSSEAPPVSSEPSSSSETSSSETPSEVSSSEISSSSETTEPSSSPSSDGGNDDRPSSRPNNNNNNYNNEEPDNNNDTSHRPNTNQTTPGTIADAPDDKRDVLSSENWDELLGSVISSTPESTGSEAEPTVGGIFSNKNSGGGGVSIALIIGIILLALGAGGVAFFIYSQFFYKRRKGDGPEDFPDSGAEPYDDYEDYDYNDNYQDYEDPGEDVGYTSPPSSSPRQEAPPDYNTAPIAWLDSDRDIRSHTSRSGGTPVRDNSHRSDRTPSPDTPAPPKTTEDKMREIDWDKFFKDNQ